ncbi:hypothetical protein [Autumnicola edwardsiae]|uniref:Lipocalin-like domain-containing protein n=1 Tax=Autumnicola edwardsiae TaxID=3075594 RepID=A0ABU3CQ80_9FLAO|nr:hypothetical protein [Zunongwangia sp. F297]MDT0648515.1 hypothetical protein [Zunongwangia sp. F297]
MNRLKKLAGAFGMIVMVAGLTISCEPESDEMATSSKEVLKVSNATIEQSALVGRWELSSMTSDVAVDLDEPYTNDSTDTSTNILEETDCFNEMYFDFGDDNKVITGQAKLDFADGFSCNYGTYSATYNIVNENDATKLVVTFEIDGMTITDSKTIELTTDESGQEFLHVILTDQEVDDASYINDGREDTVVKDITRLETIYTKVQ